jgi:hypothetical protein
MFGLYYLVRDVLVAFAAFGGALLWRMSPELNLKVAFGFGVIGTLWFAWRGRDFTVPPTMSGGRSAAHAHGITGPRNREGGSGSRKYHSNGDPL